MAFNSFYKKSTLLNSFLFLFLVFISCQKEIYNHIDKNSESEKWFPISDPLLTSIRRYEVHEGFFRTIEGTTCNALQLTVNHINTSSYTTVYSVFYDENSHPKTIIDLINRKYFIFSYNQDGTLFEKIESNINDGAKVHKFESFNPERTRFEFKGKNLCIFKVFNESSCLLREGEYEFGEGGIIKRTSSKDGHKVILDDSNPSQYIWNAYTPNHTTSQNILTAKGICTNPNSKDLRPSPFLVKAIGSNFCKEITTLCPTLNKYMNMYFVSNNNRIIGMWLISLDMKTKCVNDCAYHEFIYE